MATNDEQGLAQSAVINNGYNNGLFKPYYNNGVQANNPNMMDAASFNSTQNGYDFSGVANSGMGTNYTSNSNNNNAGQSWTDTIAGWFKPQGTQGTSTGGNILSGIGAGVGAASGLAGMYYSKKNFDLQKDQYDYLKSRDALSDNRTNKFAANVGNGAVS